MLDLVWKQVAICRKIFCALSVFWILSQFKTSPLSILPLKAATLFQSPNQDWSQAFFSQLLVMVIGPSLKSQGYHLTTRTYLAAL